MKKNNGHSRSPFYALHIGLGMTIIIIVVMGWNIYWENNKLASIINQQITRLEQNVHTTSLSINRKRLYQEKKLYQLDIIVTVIAVLLAIILLLITWSYILRTLYIWRKKITSNNLQLKHINQHLDELVHKRTEHLRATYQEKQQLAAALQQNQKLQAIGTLAAGVAHDFNNYLGIILAHSEFLHAKLNNEQQQQANTNIINTTHKASHLIEQLLTFARRSKHQKQLLNLNDVINEAIELITVNLPKNIQVETELADELTHVNADKNQMLQVILNIALNAIDSMPHGGKFSIKSQHYHLKTDNISKTEKSPINYIKIDLIDTGNGMSQELIEHIFEPFYSTKDVGKGTGLGLATAFSIMQQHQGTILVTSTNRQGSCFSLLFPL